MYLSEKKKFLFYETLYFPTDAEYQESMIKISAQEAAQEVAEKGIMPFEEAFPIALRDAREAAEEQKNRKGKRSEGNRFHRSPRKRGRKAMEKIRSRGQDVFRERDILRFEKLDHFRDRQKSQRTKRKVRTQRISCKGLKL